jgi:hypothetical protein
VIVECITVRKIYYRLLLSQQRVKDEIVLTSLSSQARSSTDANRDDEKRSSSDNANTSTSSDIDLVKEAQDNKRRQMKIKRRIRRVEKYFFAVYYIALAFLITFASLLGRFA